MKKLILAAALVAVSATSAIAQDETFAPAAGDFSVEVQFNPFSNDFGTFKLDQLKGRYFFSDKDAVRLGIGFGLDNQKDTSDPDNNEDVWSKDKIGSFSINLGYERHFFNYKRVDLYAGAGLGFALKSVNHKSQKVVGNTTREEQICNALTIDNPDIEKRAYTEFNVHAFTGIDFYVYKGLFVGAELGIKFATRNYPAYYTKGGEDNNGNWSNNLEGDKRDKVSETNLKTYVEPALRLGWTF